MTPARVASRVSVGECLRRHGGRIAFQRLGQTEIEDLDFAVAGEFDVGRFQIAVNDALFVRGFERVGDLAGDGESLVNRNGSRRDTFGERGPVDEFHHQRSDTAGFLKAVNSGDIGMVQRCQRLRFALEAGHAVGVLSESSGQYLDGHLAMQPGVLRAVDLTHSARADGREDFVGTEASSGGKGHGC